MITNTALVIATARQVSPAIVRLLETTSSRSLSCWRQRRRWYELGAIRSTVESAVAMKATKKMSRSSLPSFGKPFANGTASRKANSTWTPGSATRSSLQELDQLSVMTVFLSLVDHRLLFQPGRALETGVLLDGAENALQNHYSREDDLTGPIGQLVDALSLAAP